MATFTDAPQSEFRKAVSCDLSKNRRATRPPFLGSRRESSRHLVSARIPGTEGTPGRDRTAAQLSRRTERGHPARASQRRPEGQLFRLSGFVLSGPIVYKKDQTPLAPRFEVGTVVG
jgi:hypothetical protein